MHCFQFSKKILDRMTGFNKNTYHISERRRSCCVTNRRVEDRIKAVLFPTKGKLSSNC
ncbi:hypothetical protein [Holospora elegans]|uniref:hypothetical protein n=1 Tax=Holospora elegans TaxID=431043 RepID=UPI0019D3703B|nr:hypothetical protein [Holospora elegans]